MTDIIKALSLTKEDFLFIKRYGYSISAENIYNDDDSSAIWAEVILKRQEMEINISIYPQNIYKININIFNKMYDDLISMKDYIDQKAGNAPRNVPMYILDKDNFEISLEVYAKKIENLFENDLNKVVQGEEWIDIPSHDLRDDY